MRTLVREQARFPVLSTAMGSRAPHMPVLACLAASLLQMGGLVQGQNSLSSFEVSSVRLHNPDAPLFAPECANGLFRTSAPIFNLIAKAYNLRFPQDSEMEDQLPSWAKSRDGVFDIQAKSELPVPAAQCWLMLRALLEDRFKLAFHWEVKEGSVYELMSAPGGHKMRRASDSDTESGFYYMVNGRLVRPPPGSPDVPVLKGMTMADFARLISPSTPDRLGVVDKTGLDGLFKVDLRFSTDPLQYTDPDLPAALQKQLGLKLERRKGAVSHFVLDRMQRPDSN